MIFDDLGEKMKTWTSKGNFIKLINTLYTKFIDFPIKIIYFSQFSKYHQQKFQKGVGGGRKIIFRENLQPWRLHISLLLGKRADFLNT